MEERVTRQPAILRIAAYLKKNRFLELEETILKQLIQYKELQS